MRQVTNRISIFARWCSGDIWWVNKNWRQITEQQNVKNEKECFTQINDYEFSDFATHQRVNLWLRNVFTSLFTCVVMKIYANCILQWECCFVHYSPKIEAIRSHVDKFYLIVVYPTRYSILKAENIHTSTLAYHRINNIS